MAESGGTNSTRTETIRESTKQTKKRTAEQMEAQDLTCQGRSRATRSQASAYIERLCGKRFLALRVVANLKAFGKLAGVRLGRVFTVLPRVRMLPGENQRERVLTAEDEQQYFQGAVELGRQLDDAYRRALQGIRATKRGAQPKRPDAYLLRDVMTILIDCGLRPEECHRLRRDNIRDGAIEIFTGKRKASRRRIPASPRVLSSLDMRRATCLSDWIFPADTKSGHIETGTLKKQHAKVLTASDVPAFVPYDLRHSCLTR